MKKYNDKKTLYINIEEREIKNEFEGRHNFDDKVYCFFIGNGPEFTDLISSVFYIKSFLKMKQKIHIFGIQGQNVNNNFVLQYLNSIIESEKRDLIRVTFFDLNFNGEKAFGQKRALLWGSENYFYKFNEYLIIKNLYREKFILHTDTILINPKIHEQFSNSISSIIGGIYRGWKDAIGKENYENYIYKIPEKFGLNSKEQKIQYEYFHFLNTGFLYIDQEISEQYKFFLIENKDYISRYFFMTRFAEQEFLTIFRIKNNIKIHNTIQNEASTHGNKLYKNQRNDISKNTSHIHIDGAMKPWILNLNDPYVWNKKYKKENNEHATHRKSLKVIKKNQKQIIEVINKMNWESEIK